MSKSDGRKPLFMELSDDHYRTDAYSGPHGFVVGGMARPTKLELAEQYMLAANSLVEAIKRQELEDFRIANPVLFLYRHAIELALKALLRSTSMHHKLDALGADLKKFARDNYQQDVPVWISRRLDQLAAIDPNSMAFRYAEDKYDGRKDCSPVDGELYAGVAHFQQAMNELFGVLAGAVQRSQ
jgi:hypothetical protein